MTRGAQKQSTGWNISHAKTIWHSWVCSAWRKEGSDEIWYQPSIWKRAIRNGDRLVSRVFCDRTMENVFSLKEGRFRLDIRKVVRHCSRLPRDVVMPHLWRHSTRPGWSRCWATWWSCGCPCSLQGSWTRWPLKIPSNSKDSMSVWFYEITNENSTFSLSQMFLICCTD